jgi:hypothetical protein
LISSALFINQADDKDFIKSLLISHGILNLHLLRNQINIIFSKSTYIGQEKETKNQKLEWGWYAYSSGMNIEMGLGRSKEDRRDDPVGDVIHICMETAQGNSLCN